MTNRHTNYEQKRIFSGVFEQKIDLFEPARTEAEIALGTSFGYGYNTPEVEEKMAHEYNKQKKRSKRKAPN